MANTFTQIFIQIVFTVKARRNLIPLDKREKIHKYITGIISKRGHKLLSINSQPDHIHIFIGMKPQKSLSDLVRDIKTASSMFIKREGWIKNRFEWQNVYGAFSYSISQISNVIKYRENQDNHHKKKSFREEYLGLLDEFEIEYNNKYLFDFIE